MKESLGFSPLLPQCLFFNNIANYKKRKKVYLHIYILISLSSTTLPHVHHSSPLDFFFSIRSHHPEPSPLPHLTLPFFFFLLSFLSSRTFSLNMFSFLIFIEHKLLPLLYMPVDKKLVLQRNFQKNYQTQIQLLSIYESPSIINPGLRTAATTQPNPSPTLLLSHLQRIHHHTHPLQVTKQ